MSSDANNKLSREELQALFLQHTDSNAVPDVQDDKVSEYDFRQPHYFNKKQLALLDNYFETLSACLANEFSNMCNNKFNAKIVSITEIFSENLINTSQDEKMPYNLAIEDNTSNLVSGFLSIPPESTQLWTTQLLGETEPSESGQLCDLELSLLVEIATSLIKAFSNSHSSLNFKPVSETLSRSVPMHLDNCIEMSKIVFDFSDKEGKSSSQASLILFSSCLDSIAGKANLNNIENTEQNCRQLITEHIEKEKVELVANFAKIRLTVEDMMNLQPDDVILLDKKLGQPINLTIDEKKFFEAQVVQCENCYGVSITKALNNNIN